MRKLCRETTARKDTPLNPFVKIAVFGVLGPLLIGLLYFSLMKHVDRRAILTRFGV
jgi:NhaP-type Na+/H+ or K+/H+ antiporter